MILARHADSMLWAGRYLERADTIARCVWVEANAVMHRQPTEARLASRRLVQALGLQEEFVAARVSTGPYAVMDFLVSDDSHPGSVVSSVGAVRENLRIVRDRIPVELWEEANSLHILMQSAKAVSAGTREQTGGEVSRMSVITARRGCRSLSGVMTESMMRDEGYAFMEVGRLLERSILTVELLKSGLGTGGDVFDGNRLLAFTHSLQAAHREIGHSPSWAAVARFLLQHSNLPRSVLWCLGRVEQRLEDLAAAAGAVATPRRRAGALRAHLEYGELDGSLAEEPETELAQLGTALATLATRDYFGTTVDHLGVRGPHEELLVVAEASVETTAIEATPEPVSCERLRDQQFLNEHVEYLAPSQHVQWGDLINEVASWAIGSAADEVREQVLAIIQAVPTVLTYEHGSTSIGVTLEELIDGGRGVCQDFAHLAVGMLRCVGIPARYVSGYLFALDETQLDWTGADEVSAVPAGWAEEFEAAGSADDVDGVLSSNEPGPAAVSVQTHAWIEAVVPGSGWYALDPTNGGSVGERHVIIGHGRDYNDVPPVRGVFHGSADAEVDAEVIIAQPTAPISMVTEPIRRRSSVAVSSPANVVGRQQATQQHQQQQ